MKKLIQYANEYDNIVYARMQNENSLCTLKEQLSFQRKYNQQREQEFKYLKNTQYEIDDQFNKTEFENIIQKIRLDIYFLKRKFICFFLVKIIKIIIKFNYRN